MDRKPFGKIQQPPFGKSEVEEPKQFYIPKPNKLNQPNPLLNLPAKLLSWTKNGLQTKEIEREKLIANLLVLSEYNLALKDEQFWKDAENYLSQSILEQTNKDQEFKLPLEDILGILKVIDGFKDDAAF